jgi:CheY-like chemotaxis protein
LSLGDLESRGVAEDLPGGDQPRVELLAEFSRSIALERSVMSTHFPTVPVEVARQNISSTDTERVLPLVLVVDDEPLIAETLAAILNNSGLAALTAPDALAALEIVHLTPPEMLISDVAMPGMNGFDLAIEVTKAIPDCEIILFSGQATPSEMEAMNRAAGRDFVTLIKPVHPADLLARVYERLSPRGFTTPAAVVTRSSSLH